MCCDACFNLGLPESVRLLAHLYSLRDDSHVAGQRRFGITPRAEHLGLAIPTLRTLARAHRRDHALAHELWASGVHDARLLATFVANPRQLTRAEAQRWVRDADNWALTDALAFLVDRTDFAAALAHTWSARRAEFVKRTGFAVLAGMAIHRKELPDAVFLTFLPVIARESTDDRNFVKKAVNWALRQIGKRNPALRRAALAEAKRIARLDSPSARWIAADALLELTK
jgi:3-methyladenine DNA glycosylase AlkD